MPVMAPSASCSPRTAAIAGGDHLLGYCYFFSSTPTIPSRASYPGDASPGAGGDDATFNFTLGFSGQLQEATPILADADQVFEGGRPSPGFYSCSCLPAFPGGAPAPAPACSRRQTHAARGRCPDPRRTRRSGRTTMGAAAQGGAPGEAASAGAAGGAGRATTCGSAPHCASGLAGDGSPEQEQRGGRRGSAWMQAWDWGHREAGRGGELR